MQTINKASKVLHSDWEGEDCLNTGILSTIGILKQLEDLFENNIRTEQNQTILNLTFETDIPQINLCYLWLKYHKRIPTHCLFSN